MAGRAVNVRVYAVSLARAENLRAVILADDGLPDLTVLRAFDRTTGSYFYEAQLEVVGMTAQRQPSTGERHRGVVSLDPIVAYGKTSRALIDATIDAATLALEASQTDPPTIRELLTLVHLVGSAVRRALRVFDPSIL